MLLKWTLLECIRYIALFPPVLHYFHGNRYVTDPWNYHEVTERLQIHGHVTGLSWNFQGCFTFEIFYDHGTITDSRIFHRIKETLRNFH